MAMQICIRCNKEKPAVDFIGLKGLPVRRCASCRERDRQVLVTSRAKDKNKTREKNTLANQAWRRKNRAAKSAHTHKYNALKKGNGGTYTPEEWEQVKLDQDYKCLLCGKQEPEVQLTVDHRVPVSLGGPNCIENIDGLCKSCNSSKGAKILDINDYVLPIRFMVG